MLIVGLFDRDMRFMTEIISCFVGPRLWILLLLEIQSFRKYIIPAGTSINKKLMRQAREGAGRRRYRADRRVEAPLCRLAGSVAGRFQRGVRQRRIGGTA